MANDIHVEYDCATSEQFPVLFAPTAPWKPTWASPPDLQRGFWELVFIDDRDGVQKSVELKGELDVADAVAIAQEIIWPNR